MDYKDTLKKAKRYKTAGQPRKIESATELLDKAVQYMESVDAANIWNKPESVKFKGNASILQIPLKRPYSMNGFCLYLGLAGSYFRSAKGLLINKKESGNISNEDIHLLEAIELIEDTFREQQIEGAILGAFHPNIVARVQGLTDNHKVTTDEPSVNIIVQRESAAKVLNTLKTNIMNLSKDETQ